MKKNLLHLKNYFSPCKTLEQNIANKIIKKSNLLLFESASLKLKYNIDLNIIIQQRNKFINEIIDFTKSEKMLLKIYGTKGIVKSISLLFFSTIKNDYKTIYINLKDIYKSNLRAIDYFNKATMKYYTHFDFSYG